MNTRSTSKGLTNNLNSSRGRGRTVLTPKATRSLEDFPISNPTRAQVVHSPPPGKINQFDLGPPLDQENTTRSLEEFLSIPSTGARVVHSPPTEANTRTNYIAIDQENLGLDSMNVSLPPVESIENEGNNRSNMATKEDDAPIAESGSQNANGELLAAVQEAIRSSRNEFRAEMNALRATISNMTGNPLPIQNASTISHGQNLSDRIKLEKWKIHFDGTGSVTNFLFKIDTMAKRTLCSDEHLLSNFQIFLGGKAEEWYWDFMKRNEDPSYSFLKFSISREFGKLESDDEILINIHKRKQHQKESYDSFHSAIVAMNSRMGEPLAEKS